MSINTIIAIAMTAIAIIFIFGAYSVYRGDDSSVDKTDKDGSK